MDFEIQNAWDKHDHIEVSTATSNNVMDREYTDMIISTQKYDACVM
jgi:hypothetical protein